MDGTKAMKRSSATTRRLLSTFIAMARAVLCCAVCVCGSAWSHYTHHACIFLFGLVGAIQCHD